jgi:hypothetical protein
MQHCTLFLFFLSFFSFFFLSSPLFIRTIPFSTFFFFRYLLAELYHGATPLDQPLATKSVEYKRGTMRASMDADAVKFK